MTTSKIIPPVFLVHREPIAELLEHQVWADNQLRALLSEADRCVNLAARKKMTPAGARARLARIARGMHQAITEFNKVAKIALRPVTAMSAVIPSRVPVPHGHNTKTADHTPGHWEWQAPNPAIGCLALEACDWNDQIRAADLWVQRALHRALTLRATGEYLAVRLDGLERAGKMMADLGKQLDYAANEFWSRFTLAESIGFRRAQAA
jgi:hypothetical protein